MRREREDRPVLHEFGCLGQRLSERPHLPPSPIAAVRRLLAIGLVLMAGCTEAPTDDAPWTWRNPFLGNDPFRIVIDHVEGRAPSEVALEGLRQTIRDMGAQANITVRGTLHERGRPYAPQDIYDVHVAHQPGSDQTWRDASGTGVLHVLYLDGNSTTDEGTRVVHGTAFGRQGIPLMAIFPDTLPTTSLFLASVELPGQSRGGFERAVLVHEFGHMLGLVGCGLPEVQPHANAESACHSRSDSSVMAAAVHAAADPMDWTFDDEMQPIWHFDADDWADIRAGQAALDTTAE